MRPYSTTLRAPYYGRTCHCCPGESREQGRARARMEARRILAEDEVNGMPMRPYNAMYSAPFWCKTSKCCGATSREQGRARARMEARAMAVEGNDLTDPGGLRFYVGPDAAGRVRIVIQAPVVTTVTLTPAAAQAMARTLLACARLAEMGRKTHEEDIDRDD